MTNPTILGDLALAPTLDTKQFWAEFSQLQTQIEREQSLKLKLNTGEILTSLDRVKQDMASLGSLTAKQANEQTRSARVLSAQYQANMRAVNEQNAAVLAAHRAQTAAGKAELAATRERTARLREQQAQLRLNAQMASQAARDEKQRATASITALSNEMVSYRSMWTARQINDQQLIESQRRIQQQALLQAQAVDKTSEAYRRLTQVAAGAQRAIDRAEGVNPRGGLAEGVSLGLQSALGQFGVAGDLLGGFIQYITAKRAAAMNVATQLGSDTMEGLVKGMKSDQAEVKSTAEKVASSIENTVREELDIHSPSRVMEYLGRMVGDGFASGIRARWDDARRAAAGLSHAAADGISVNAMGAGGLAGLVAGGGLELAKVSATSDAVDNLNKQLATNAAASATAARAGAATEVATEALGGAVEGAAEQVRSFTDARKEEDDVQRQAALNDAKTALAFTAVAAAATAATTAIVLNYNAAADYQAGMLKAQATTEATASQMDRLSEVALSKPLMDLAVNGIDAAAGIEELGSQGLNTSQIIDGGLITSLTLAKAVNADVAKSASVAAAATKAFGLEASDMARVGDIVTNAVNGTSVKMDNFTDAIAAGGAVAQSTGMDFVTFTAAISFMTDKAIAASDAGTSLKSFLQALTPNSAAARDEMKKLGFTAFTADGQFKDLGTIVEELRAKFMRLTPEQRATTAETIFGADGIRAFNILVAEGSAGLKTRIELLDRTGTMTAAAEKKLAGARGEQEKFNAALKNFQIVSGEFFLPAGEKVLSFLSRYLEKAVAVNRETEKMNKGMGAFGAQEYNLPSWLQQSGLKANQLTSTETKQVTDLLKAMQAFANEGALEATKYRNLGLNAIADQIDLNTLKRIGMLGKELGQLQKIISIRESGGNPLVPAQPTTAGQSVLDRMPLDAKAAAFFKAIFGQESGAEKNPYKAFNTDYSNGGGQGALGKYQVMPQNLLGLGWDVPQSQRGAWAKANLDNRGVRGAGWDFQALKKDITPREFLNSPEYQEAIAQAQMTANLQKRLLEAGGDLEKAVKEAAKDWYGRVAPAKGPTPDQYAASVWNRFTGQATLGGQTVAIPSKDPLIQTKDKGFSDYIKEAKRLSDAVAKYAPGGAAPNSDKWKAATAELKKFTASSDVAAQAMDWVSLEAGKSGKAVSQYGQAFDRLKGQLDITASLDNLGRPAAEITSRLDTIRRQALAGAEAEKKRWGETAKYKALLDLAGDAAKKLEQVRGRKPELTDLQRDQQQQQDAVARQRMEASLRAASNKRLQQLVDGGVTPEVSLVKWQAAQSEIKRRQDAQDKDEKKRDEDRKVAGQNRLAAERALADGQFELADRTAGLVIKTYDRQVKSAGDSAAARLDIEERLGADVLAARETQARVAAQQEKTRLERERNTAVNATGLTLAQRQKLWNQYGDKIRQVDADLAETLVGIQEDATRQMADLQQRAFSEENVGKAESYAERLRATIASLPGQDEEGLITVYGEARAARDQELLAAVYDEWERRRQQAEEEARVVAQIQSEANLSAAQAGVATAEQMISEGDTEGALQFLSDLGDGFQAMSDQGEDAVDAINYVIDAVNRLAGASAVSDEFNTFVAGLSGTIDEQIGQVVSRLEEVTDPAMRAKLQGLLKDLRADLPKYVDPYAAGYVPGTNGFVATGDTPVPDLEEVAKARDLGTLLNETTDPAQVQALMGEVVDLLASEVGQRLPDSIRTGLEESVTGAQGYLDALAQITEDGVVDGWERAAKGALANPLPTNRFSDFSTQIFTMGAAGLSDPTQYDALTSSLQQARAASQLTEADLQNLLALIEELRNPKTPEIGKAFDFGQWQTDIQTLTDDFDSGRMTADEYSSGLRDAAVQLNDLADQAERMGNLKLAGQFRELAGSMRAMTPEIAGLLKGLGKVQEYAGYVQDLAGAFSTLAEGVGNDDLAANLNGLGNLAGKVAALAGDVMRIIANPADIGAWVGAITKVISGIAEAINGYRKAYAQAKQMQDDFNARFTLINGNDFAKTTVRSRGWLADTFGGGPEVKQVVDEFGLKIAQAIEGGVMGGIKSGMKQAMSTGDWTNFSNTFRQSAYDGVVDGLIEAIFNDALKTILAPGIKALTDAAKTESTADDDAAITEFERGLGQAEQFLTRAGQRIQPGLDRLRADLGITTPSNTSGVDTTGLSTMPEPIQMTLATPLLEGVRGIKEAADMQKDAAATSKAAAELILATFKDGVKVTVQQGTGSYTSTTSTLV